LLSWIGKLDVYDVRSSREQQKQSMATLFHEKL
jgi:hypothetical protein